jgi:hypothetical protein
LPNRPLPKGAAHQETPRPTIVGAVAGEERRRRFGERLAGDYTWLPYDSLELLPHLLEGVAVAGVVVDLVRWVPVEAAPVLRDLRGRWPALRVVGLYEPSAEALPELARLARVDRCLAFVSDADERLELLLRPVSGALGAIVPTVCQSLLDRFLPLVDDPGVRGTLIDLALAPSRRRGVPALAAAQGWSEDALERRFAAAGLAAPAAVRRLAAAAEGLWQVAALKRPADDVARALGLGTGDSLGRILKSVFGFGLKPARLMGGDGVREALAWTGLLALRQLAATGGVPQVARVRLEGIAPESLQDVERFAAGERAGELVRRLVTDRLPLGTLVDRLSAEPDAGRFLASEVVPLIGRLLHHHVVAPAGPPLDPL